METSRGGKLEIKVLPMLQIRNGSDLLPLTMESMGRADFKMIREIEEKGFD